MKLPPPFQEKTLAAFGAKGKFWSNVGDDIESLFGKTIHVDPKMPNSPTASHAVQQADTIFFSVPDDEFPSIIQEIRSLLRGKQVIENLTTKDVRLLEMMRDFGAEVCSVHTMVKTDSSHQGQTAIILPFEDDCDETAEMVSRIVSSLGMVSEFMPIEKHKPSVSLPQALEHLNARLFIRALLNITEEHQLSLEQLERIAPASQQLCALGRNRIAIQDSGVSFDIIHHNPEIFRHMRNALDQLEDLFRCKNAACETIDGDTKKMGITEERKKEIKQQTDDFLQLIQKG